MEIPVNRVQANAADAPNFRPMKFNPNDRRNVIGGSEARVIMGDQIEARIKFVSSCCRAVLN
jgi:hypothetical protein